MENSFEAKKKENVPELRYAHLAPEIWEALRNLPRTGWVRRGIENPESVQEHTLALREIAFSIEEFSVEEKRELLDMLEVHDWPEAIKGDPVILAEGEERKKLKAEKFAVEHEVMIEICSRLGNDGPRVLGLWTRFEKSEDSISSFARDIDKYQAVEKAFEYEQKFGLPITQEFIDYAKKYIAHPKILEKLNQIQELLSK